MKIRALLTAAVLLTASLPACAGGPRFVTGTAYTGAPAGQIMAFYTSQPLYFTDPGDLSATVSHAQADAMVAAAASVWNVPTSSLTLAQGGELAEHISSANSYFDGNEVVFPADVQPTNYQSTPIAIIYDTDGSITDLLLGSGASDPSGCRQAGVTESVDGFGETGTIEHAVIVLNGRCVGSTPEQLTQMQYQLMRAFGRVIGLAWSQLNDNVFTGVPTPNADQAAYWPVMHPIDVICGPYTYQCMGHPFTLRPDDLSALALLYPVTSANLTPGKTLSDLNAISIDEYLAFPDGQGMDMVNLTVRYTPFTLPTEDFEVVSGVSGATYRMNSGNPVTGIATDASGNVGSYDPMEERETLIGRVPFPGTTYYSLPITTESINPLYSGDYAIAPYEGEPVAMSGAPVTDNIFWGAAGTATSYLNNLVVSSAPTTCSPGNDGVESAPVPTDPSGWWGGLICGPGHVSWLSASVKAGHSWTLEMTALNEAGEATTQKLRPMIGVWNSGDPTGTLPTVAATPGPFNSTSLGMTQLAVAASSQDATLRIALADKYGAGRPDLTYTARILYADTISPAVLGTSGGQITITGTGFRPGNEVMVNGVAAKAISWTSTQIVAIAPSMAMAGASASTPLDVAVIDPSTNGQTLMSGVLSYVVSEVDTIQLVSAPAVLETGIAATTSFAVRVFAPDGVTPLAGASVQFAVDAGSAALAACGITNPCFLTTDATGLAQTMVTGSAAGKIVLSATEVSGSANVQVSVNDVDPLRTAAIAVTPLYLAAGAPASWSLSLAAMQDSNAASGEVVAWSATGGLTMGSAQGLTDAAGSASVTASTTGLAAGTQSVVTGCVWATVCASATAYGVDPSFWTVAVASGAGQSVAQSTSLAPVVLLVTDGAGHPLQGAMVQVYQTVDAWEGACPAKGPCPSAPVLASSQSTQTTGSSGSLSVTPLVVAGVPQVINIEVSAGTDGFVALTLVKTP